MSGYFVSNVGLPPADALKTGDERRREEAREKLLKYRWKLEALLGDNFENDPRFQKMIEDLVRGRAIWNVFADYQEAPAKYPAVDRTNSGW